ncbi:MAG: DMT family transporter [Candidatus Dadabacteria bacterium]|nr:DMT family transporter [Candidatus Dadabacteria bacterium]
MNRTVINILLLVFVILTWGYSWVLMKIGLGYMEPFTLAVWRCGIAAVILLVYVKSRSIKLPHPRRWPDFMAVGLFQTTLLFGLMLLGMKRITAGKTSVLLYTMPVWTILLVHFYLKEKINTRQWAGVLLGSAGILSILGWDIISKQNPDIFLGEMLIIIAAISWAVSNIWVKKRMAGEDIYRLSALQLSFGTIGLLIIAMPTHGVFNVEWTLNSVYILLFTGLIASAVDFTIWFYLIKKLDINITTFSSMLVPVFGLFFDWLILGSRLDWGTVTGGALILAGIYMVSRK